MNNLPAENFSEPLLTGRDIVFIGIAHWDTQIGSNSRNMARQMAKHNRVLYINYPITRKTYMQNLAGTETDIHRKIIKEKTEPLKKVDDNLWVYYPTTLVESVKWLPVTSLFKAANYFNNRRFAKDIKKAVKAVNFKDIILFDDNDIYNGYYMKELLKPAMYIYYFKDFLQGFSYWKKHAVTMEPELIKKMDAVVTNSVYYNEYCSTLTKKSWYIGQGCDLKKFTPDKDRAIPDDMKSISGPVIGYVGVLSCERLDEKILELLAKENPEWNIVLAGPEDDFFKQSHLHKYSNVHFLGWKPLDELPAYIAAFDVCMNPQLKNDITKGNYPLKIDEYLAMGKPVVATRTIAMKLFEDYTYLADKPEDYSVLVKKAMEENTKNKEDQRIAFANTHTWNNSVAKVYEIILNHFKKAH